MYLARTMPPRLEVVEAFRDWDSCLEDCFKQLFPPGTWEQDPDRARGRVHGFRQFCLTQISHSLRPSEGIAAAIWLGLPIQQLQVAGRCVCGTAYVDPADPHHALRCKHQHGPSRVHDEVKFAVANISKASGGVETMEDSVVLQGKRVDVAVRRPMAGEAHALEISIADPLSLSPSLLGQCGRQIGVAAREWERRKTSDYAPLLARNRGVQFTPLIDKTWGCLGGRFRQWLRQQGDAHVGLAVSRRACREDDSVFSAYLLGSLKALIGVALQRAQARVILLRAASSMGGINVDLVDRECGMGCLDGVT
ncbi:unnamed protein product [Closterium sp. NIES-65]|nr:unnamed protein product [Closterium sp. NIES-65]CAI5948706.1 unnamed protein product [Closterium sp. NIES-65]